jgi:formate dehydrogenase major subunit
VLWRGPYSDKWQIVTWTDALQQIAFKINQARDAGFEANDSGITVNRLNNVACLGGAAHDNQECYLLRKLVTGLGIVYVEHQARI